MSYFNINDLFFFLKRLRKPPFLFGSPPLSGSPTSAGAAVATAAAAPAFAHPAARAPDVEERRPRGAAPGVEPLVAAAQPPPCLHAVGRRRVRGVRGVGARAAAAAVPRAAAARDARRPVPLPAALVEGGRVRGH